MLNKLLERLAGTALSAPMTDHNNAGEGINMAAASFRYLFILCFYSHQDPENLSILFRLQLPRRTLLGPVSYCLNASHQHQHRRIDASHKGTILLNILSINNIDTMFSCSNQPRGCRGRCDSVGGKCRECKASLLFHSSQCDRSNSLIRCTTSANNPHTNLSSHHH